MEKYSYSLNEEEFYSAEYMETLIEEYEHEENCKLEYLYRGINVKQEHINFISGISILEDMSNMAYDNFDEYSYGYLEDKDYKEKAKQLEIIVSNFMNENFEKPRFYAIEKVEKITYEQFLESY